MSRDRHGREKISYNDFPEQPGVYLMKDSLGTVLYIGKANNLKVRIKQYFIPGRDGRPQVPYLIERVVDIETIVVSSEKEALLLENTLIKRYKPKYNVLLKDDKSYLTIKISKHRFPMISLSRYKGLPPADGDYFGPYTQSKQARQMFDLVARLFPLRQCSDEELVRRKRPCLLHQIKRCLAPCVNLCTEKEYALNVARGTQLLKGENESLIAELRKQMYAASDALEYEKAQEILNKITLLEQLGEKQKVFAIHSANVDVIGLHRSGNELLICLLRYRHHDLVESVQYEFEATIEEDEELLQSFLLQHYLRTGEYVPTEILIPVPIMNDAIITEILFEQKESKVTLLHPQRGEKKALIVLAQENAKVAFMQRKDLFAIREKQLLDMQELFQLTHFPTKIECFDNSHLSGTSIVSSMVTFLNGEKQKAGYRKFLIRSLTIPDDYAILREALQRRYSHAKQINNVPDLLVIDGGKGHYNIAIDVLSALDIISVNVIAIAKEGGRHDKGLTQEQVYYQGSSTPLVLDRHHPVLLFLQTIRDEAHRFAITFHQKRRSKAIIKSALDDVPGIGPMKKRKLLQAFGSVKTICQKGVEELSQIPGITQKDAQAILAWLKK